MTENLSTKNIREFVAGDTLYIIDTSEFNTPFYLCEFIKFEKGYVYGKQIEATINKRYFNKERAKVLKASVSRCALYGKSVEGGTASYRRFDSSGYAMHPDELRKVSESGDTFVAKHPSYGMISLSKSNMSGSHAFFGSSVKSGRCITLRIARGELDRDLNNDWYHATQDLIEVQLTQNQFSELITSMNQGDGIPCTISRFNKEIMPQCPFNSKIEQFQDEFKNKVKNYSIDLESLLRQATEILENPKAPNKGQRTELLDKIKKAVQDVQSNMPYIKNQFDEQMSKSVAEAKSEIEAYLSSVIVNKGLEGLMGDNENMIEIE